MNMIVCVKQVPDSYTVRLDPVTNTIQREQAKSILNPFDLFAVEEAVRLKSRFGGHITAISMGIPAASAALREAMAMGVDDGVLLSDRCFAGADTIATGCALKHGIRRQGSFDLIVCGRMATDGDTAQVPPILAELLHIPCLTDVCEVISCEDGVLRCRRMGDDGYGIWECALPALITVTKECNVPRLASIAGLRYAHGRPVTTWTAEDLPDLDRSLVGLRGSATQVKRTFVPQNSTSIQMLKGGAAQQARDLTERLCERRII